MKAIARVYKPKTSGKDTDTINELDTLDDWELEYPEGAHDGRAGSRPSPLLYSILLVDLTLKNAIRQRASDIHVEAYFELFRVRFRIDGILETVYQLPYSYFGPSGRKVYLTINRLWHSAGIKAPPELPGDGRIPVTLRTPALQRQMTFRVSYLPIVSGARIVLRPCEEEGHRVTALSPTGSELSPADLFPGWPKDRKERALIAAAQTGQIDLVRALLSSGVDACARRHGLTALMAAAQKGQTQVVQELLESGADASAEDSGMTALQMAAFNGHVETARALIEHGSTGLSICSEQVLSRAAMEGNEAMIRLLVERQVVDARRALCAACEYGRTEIIQWLLRQAPVDTTEALELAARWGQAEALQVLLEHRVWKVNAAYLSSAIGALIEGWMATAVFRHPNLHRAVTRRILRREVRRLTASYMDTLKLLLKCGPNTTAIPT